MKKVFIRSGIRFDFLMKDPSGEFFTDLVQHHISGQLKVAPEHCVAHTLDYMGKPHIEVYEKFREKYFKLNRRYGKDQYLVPYLISSHPGCTLEDAVQLAEWLNKQGHMPEQVQDFYPTPGTLATCMWYTGLDPRTMQPVFVPKTPHDKALQRALMQWRKPQNRKLVLEALHKTGREDLIGYGKRCLIRPDKGQAPSVSRREENSAPRGRKPPRAAAKRGRGIPERSGTAAAAPWRSRSSPTGRSARRAGPSPPPPKREPKARKAEKELNKTVPAAKSGRDGFSSSHNLSGRSPPAPGTWAGPAGSSRSGRSRPDGSGPGLRSRSRAPAAGRTAWPAR